jgi:very-short-patch-repair endonuclease
MSDLARFGAELLGSAPERALETHLKQAGFTGYVREYQFTPSRKWRFDFAWPDKMLAVEIEGGVFGTGKAHVPGRHSRGVGLTADCEKYAEALCLGWRVLRVTPAQVGMDRAGPALGWIERLMK